MDIRLDVGKEGVSVDLPGLSGIHSESFSRAPPRAVGSALASESTAGLPRSSEPALGGVQSAATCGSASGALPAQQKGGVNRRAESE